MQLFTEGLLIVYNYNLILNYFLTQMFSIIHSRGLNACTLCQPTMNLTCKNPSCGG